MKIFLILLTFSSITFCSFAQQTSALADSLMKQWDMAWNNKDVGTLKSMLQSNAIFESPYQIRISKDSIAASIFKVELASLDDVHSTELHTLVDDNMAWSIGKVTGIWSNNQPWEGTYTFEFTRKAGQDWKIQMLIFYEK